LKEKKEMRKSKRRKKIEQRERDERDKLIEEIKKDLLPYDVILYEILSFFETDSEELGVYHSLVDLSITKSDKYGCMYPGNSISQYIRLSSKQSPQEKARNRVKKFYGYFSSDKRRHIFLIFRSLKVDFKGVGYYSIVEIKDLCSLRIIQADSLHVINGVTNLYVEGSQQSTLLTRSMSNVKNLKIQNFQQLNSISNIPNVEKLTLIDCRYITNMNNLPNLRVLKIWLCGTPIVKKLKMTMKHHYYSTGRGFEIDERYIIDPTLIELVNLPKLEVLSTYSEMIDSNKPNKIVLLSQKIEDRVNTGLIKYNERPYLSDKKIKKLNFVCYSLFFTLLSLIFTSRILKCLILPVIKNPSGNVKTMIRTINTATPAPTPTYVNVDENSDDLN
jgi:hypothetical protein